MKVENMISNKPIANQKRNTRKYQMIRSQAIIVKADHNKL